MIAETTVAAVDTNEEYIQPQNIVKEPPVLTSVFKAVVVETVKDFFMSIFGFFYRYFRHFLRSFLYFWSPTLRRKPFDKLDYKENCQHSFELALLVLFMIIFAVKLDWIPQTSGSNLEILNNDLSQMALQFMWFIIFAISYFVTALLAIATGRTFRFLLRLKTTKRESDILFIYLNNAFFSITAIIALCVRAVTSMEMTDTETLGQGLMMIFLPTCFFLLLLWAIRFAVVQKMGFLKGAVFFLFSTVLFTMLYTMGGAITSIFFIVI